MLTPENQNFLLHEYPLVKLFAYGDEILVYDAKPHFAFILSVNELSILLDFLKNLPPETIYIKHSKDFAKTELIKLLENFRNLKNAGVFKKGPATEISPVDSETLRKQLEYYSENILLRKFCLEVTQNCNFACRYCKRTIAAQKGKASSLNMSEEIAFKGIHYYFEKYTSFFQKLDAEKKSLLPEIVPPTLSWYGGEPFLNFDLIKKSAAYFKSLPWEKHGIPVSSLNFTANTNLSIINEEILHFLVNNNITLFASLDGPQTEHDKCRVFPDGSGTFALAYENLLKIKAFSPSYFQNKITVFGVYTADHDYAKCVDFTGKLGTLSCQHFSVDYAGTFVFNIAAETAYYKKSLANNLVNYEEMIAKAEKKFEAHMDAFANIFPFAKLNFDHPKGKDGLNIMLTCPMGFDNLMLAANGDYLICHKVSGDLPVGNCDTGLDHDKLLDFYQKYNSSINNVACLKCWNVNFCTICAASRLNGKHFINPSNQECDCFRLRTEYDFNCLSHLARRHPALLEKIFDYRNNSKNYIGVIDVNEF